MSDHETLRAMGASKWLTPHEKAACLAGADALRAREVYPNSDRGLREMCPGVPLPILRGIQEAAFRSGREDAIPRRTCGTCANWLTNHGSGWDKRHPCHFYGGVPRTADDGCITGWSLKEVSRG